MKQKFTRNVENPRRRIFELTPFLREIDRVLPTIKTPEHRAVVVQARNFIMAISTSTPPQHGEPISSGLVSLEILEKLIETLRCCGIAPEGWPPPPSPDALIRSRQIFILGWDGTDGSGEGHE